MTRLGPWARWWTTRAITATALAGILTLLGGAAGASAATPAPATPGIATSAPDTTPDDQPLPGHTISNPPLAPLTVGGQETRVLQGVYQHAAYDIEIPPNWNGQLVMWAHGYRGEGTVLTVDTPDFGLRERFIGQGFAWAASSYYDNSYNVKAGVESTHALAVRFRALVGSPSRTYLTGVSLGGHVIGRSLEQYPRFYGAAMPMCGVLGDQELFDYFLDYNLVAQDLAGVRAYPVPADYLANAVPRIQITLGLAGLTPGGPDTLTPEGQQLRAITVNRTGGPRPGTEAAFALWKDFLFGIAARQDNGGPLAQNPSRLAQNVVTRYSPNTPVEVNRTVQRVVPTDLRSRLDPRLTDIPLIFGRPNVPVLTLHGVGDLFVPFSMEQLYARDVAFNGQSSLLVQRAIRSSGHCEFSPNEAGQAWNDLVSWVDNGGRASARPAGDPVTNPAAVAAPTFGCRFTDPSAYGTGSRPTYPTC
jgi:hypothetical protein